MHNKNQNVSVNGHIVHARENQINSRILFIAHPMQVCFASEMVFPIPIRSAVWKPNSTNVIYCVNRQWSHSTILITNHKRPNTANGV